MRQRERLADHRARRAHRRHVLPLPVRPLELDRDLPRAGAGDALDVRVVRRRVRVRRGVHDPPHAEDDVVRRHRRSVPELHVLAYVVDVGERVRRAPRRREVGDEPPVRAEAEQALAALRQDRRRVVAVRERRVEPDDVARDRPGHARHRLAARRLQGDRLLAGLRVDHGHASSARGRCSRCSACSSPRRRPAASTPVAPRPRLSRPSLRARHAPSL